MKPLTHEAEITRLYLLGGLDPEAQKTFEERLVTEGELFDELIIAEDELVDDYLENLLTENERGQFESLFLAVPERRRKLSFARSLKKYVAAHPVGPPNALVNPPKTFNWKEMVGDFIRGRSSFPVYVTTVALIFFGLSFWVWQTWRQPDPRLKLEEEVAELNRTPELPSTALRVPLAPGLTRSETGNERKRIELPANVALVQLQLEVAGDQYQSYRAVLQPADRALENVTINELKVSIMDGRRIVPLKLPARILTRGDYDLKLSGVTAGGQIEDLGRYSFRVVTR